MAGISKKEMSEIHGFNFCQCYRIVEKYLLALSYSASGSLTWRDLVRKCIGKQMERSQDVLYKVVA